MSTKNSQSANSILNRIKEAYSLRSDADLARFLQKDPSTISTWRRRDTVDHELIFSKCHDLNANYIVYGDRPRKRIRPSEDPAGQSEEQVLSYFVEKIETLELSPNAKLALFQAYLDLLEKNRREIGNGSERQSRESNDTGLANG